MTHKMTDQELYRALGALTKNRDAWRENISYVGSLLEGQSPRITAKALWLLGEMGLQNPDEAAPYVAKIASFLESQDDLLRERSLNALGRIGRARYETVKPHWDKMLALSKDGNPSVRLAFIWASENIATNMIFGHSEVLTVGQSENPFIRKSTLDLFAEFLHDSDDRVRMEAPEMFRVLGKRKPELVMPYLDQLRALSETDSNRVVRIHCLGAIKSIGQ